MMNSKNIAVLGLGLMGSSLALSLRKRNADIQIFGFARSEQARRKAEASGMVDAAYADPLDAVHDADLIIICVPIWSIAALAKTIVSALKPGAIVTDVGSTKSDLIKKMAELFAGTDAYFVGSHPIAGSEKTGIDEGNPDLYAGRLTVVCPTETTPIEVGQAVVELWKSVGSEVINMSPEEHDAMLASTSHLPHMVAAALVRSVANGDPKAKADFCGTGFRDTTRVASGSADIWVDIIDTNRAALRAELDRFHEELQGLIHILSSGNSDDIRRWLEEAADNRNRIINLNRFLKR